MSRFHTILQVGSTATDGKGGSIKIGTVIAAISVYGASPSDLAWGN